MADKDRSAKQTSDAELSERIREFESRQKEVRRPNRAQLPSGGMAMAGRVTTELVAGVVVGAFIGFDSWLGTTPTFMVVFFFIRSAAADDECVAGATGRGMAAGFVDEKSSEDGEDAAESRKTERLVHSPVEQFAIKVCLR